MYLVISSQCKVPACNCFIDILQKVQPLFQAAEDVNVTFEDQQKINKFARNTSRITELKEEIEVKKVLGAYVCLKFVLSPLALTISRWQLPHGLLASGDAS